jgi:hypothetical protein
MLKYSNLDLFTRNQSHCGACHGEMKGTAQSLTDIYRYLYIFIAFLSNMIAIF